MQTSPGLTRGQEGQPIQGRQFPAFVVVKTTVHHQRGGSVLPARGAQGATRPEFPWEGTAQRDGGAGGGQQGTVVQGKARRHIQQSRVPRQTREISGIARRQGQAGQRDPSVLRAPDGLAAMPAFAGAHQAFYRRGGKRQRLHAFPQNGDRERFRIFGCPGETKPCRDECRPGLSLCRLGRRGPQFHREAVLLGDQRQNGFSAGVRRQGTGPVHVFQHNRGGGPQSGRGIAR